MFDSNTMFVFSFHSSVGTREQFIPGFMPNVIRLSGINQKQLTTSLDIVITSPRYVINEMLLVDFGMNLHQQAYAGNFVLSI